MLVTLVWSSSVFLLTMPIISFTTPGSSPFAKALSQKPFTGPLIFPRRCFAGIVDASEISNVELRENGHMLYHI